MDKTVATLVSKYPLIIACKHHLKHSTSADSTTKWFSTQPTDLTVLKGKFNTTVTINELGYINFAGDIFETVADFETVYNFYYTECEHHYNQFKRWNCPNISYTFTLGPLTICLSISDIWFYEYGTDRYNRPIVNKHIFKFGDDELINVMNYYRKKYNYIINIYQLLIDKCVLIEKDIYMFGEWAIRRTSTGLVILIDGIDTVKHYSDDTLQYLNTLLGL